MKELNFLVSEYAEQILQINKKTRPYTIAAAIGSIILTIGLLWLFTYSKEPSRYFDDKFAFVVASPLLFLGVYFFRILEKAEKEFWIKFSEKNDGVYETFGNPLDEQAIMFRQGHTRSVQHSVMFGEGNNQTKIFRYSFSIGAGKSKTTYTYTVFTQTFERSVPHLYLNYRRDGYGVSIGDSISLPSEFEKEFDISIPKGYHIEALQIFTPEILATILDLGIKVDIELVGNQIYFFIRQERSFGMNFKKHLELLEEKHRAVSVLMRLLKPRLDRFNFAKIGDLPHTL